MFQSFRTTKECESIFIRKTISMSCNKRKLFKMAFHFFFTLIQLVCGQAQFDSCYPFDTSVILIKSLLLKSITNVYELKSSRLLLQKANFGQSYQTNSLQYGSIMSVLPLLKLTLTNCYLEINFVEKCSLMPQG